MVDTGTTGPGRKRRPDLDTVYSINTDGSRNFIHPADVTGRWQVLKNLVFVILIMVYAGLPWIRIGGRPAVHFDLPDRSAHFFGLSFTNQDFYLMFFVLTGIGFALFVVTALWGRIFCGYVCPQTVYMEGVFRKIERWIEGPRPERMRRNAGPMDAGKFFRKLVKHVLFIVMASLIAHVFVSYFIPVRELIHAVWADPGHHRTAFVWATAMTLVMYFDFSWFREQTCIVICPYGRLQSSLIDEDSLIIGYDERRGEPRSKSKTEGGDCVDCYRCVEVCPTGIDIRNGLQMECIGCANCIDACDDIMKKVGKPAGLVRYDTQRVFGGEPRRSLLRPRTFVYLLFGLVGLVVAGLAIGSRESFQVNVLRTAGMPYLIEDGRIRNLVNLRIQNKGDAPGTYLVEIVGASQSGLETLISQPRLHLEGLADGQVPIFIYLDRERYAGIFPFSIAVTDSATGESRNLKVNFRGP